ncbi:chemotaxis protein CheW [Phaeospirillum tilakii]|uniref:Chemotaxis protein CheW n=1 Tax=Phaeospirillum tilakii TaxID=741673 RepID=A0ABW5CC70_9PROT
MSEIVAQEAAAPPPPAGESPAGGDSAADGRQFVIFHVEQEMFAVPLAEVQEIIRMPEVVSVPLSPAALEGLANLRGSVLPVIRLRHVFGIDDIAHDDSTRVVVLDQGRPVGLVVDRVANVVSVEPGRIETADTIQGTVDTDLLTGMIKAADGEPMVMVLDAARVVGREFAALGAGRTGAGEPRGGGAAAADDAATTATGEESQLVSFEVAGQEYALPIERVQEIVQIPGQITEMPNTPRHVLGVMTLRNRLLPLVSLRELFGLPPQELGEANKIVVVAVEGAGPGAAVGVVMDSVKEVLRVGRAVIDPVPPLLARDGALGEIEAICRLQDGRRLVSILSAETMFSREDLRRVAGAAREEEQAMAEEEDRNRAARSDDEEQFVAFRLMNEEFGVPIEAVQEIVRVPDELTRVPKTPDFIEGVVNLRGVVLPVVDQRRRFGLPAMERSDRQRIMVYTIGGLRTGFIVDAVSEVLRIPASAIGPAPALSEEQQRLVRRVANIERQNRMILLLDVEQLLDGGELAAARRAVV